MCCGCGLRGLLGAANRWMLSLADRPPSVPLTPLAALPLGTADGAIVLCKSCDVAPDGKHYEEKVSICTRSEPLKGGKGVGVAIDGALDGALDGWADRSGGLSLELAEILGSLAILGREMLCESREHTGGPTYAETSWSWSN